MNTVHRQDMATLLAGVPSDNMAVFHRVRFPAHDPMAVIDLPGGDRVVILRDVEMERARGQVRADRFHVYEDFEPAGGLSGDRAIRAAQSVAECLRREGVKAVRSDRTLSLLYVDLLREAGIAVECDRDLGVLDRRAKTDDEVEVLRAATRMTEATIRMACETIAKAKADDDGVLLDPTRGFDEILTSERVKALIVAHIAEQGGLVEGPIVAGGPIGADCHHGGAGPLRTGEPVIIDVFPKHPNGYHGDCTRMVVHGEVPAEVARMHAVVAEAKAACIAAIRAGVTGDQAHAATVGVITGHGYRMGFPDGPIPYHGPPTGFCSMPHGTGHGLGLELKEPPLIDTGGPELIAGDAVTVEPGLYAPGLGGMRLEDLVIVREGGCENLNMLEEGLGWG